MNAVVLLLLAGAMLLIMDATRDDVAAAKEPPPRVEYVPVSAIDDQMGGQSTRDVITDMILNPSPWIIRDTGLINPTARVQTPALNPLSRVVDVAGAREPPAAWDARASRAAPV